MGEFLAVVGIMMLLAVCVLATTAWLALRRIRRSRLVTAGRELAVDGLLAMTACRLRPTPNRGAALRAVRISRDQRLLRQRVAQAQRSGAHLGDVPALLPRLETEGQRLRAGLSQLIGSPVMGHDLLARADRHLATLATLSEAVAAAAAVPVADESLAREAEEAALGLRLHSAAYAELMAMGPGGQRVLPALPVADAS